MGRPLNKRFFGDPAGGGYQVEVLADVGAGNVAAYIVSQRSNSKYLCAEVATPANQAICTLVDAVPSAVGEMQVIVTPENATATVQATIAFTSAGGTGALLTVSIADAGYGYWAPGTAVALGGTTDGTVDYTVDGNGSLATVTRNADGSANTQAGSPVALGDAPAANPPVGNARIINARTVKTFGPNGNTYDWPITGPFGSGTSTLTQADIGS